MAARAACGLRAASASWPTPCLMPPTRSPAEKADCMPATARRTASSLSERRTTDPVTTSSARAARGRPGSARCGRARTARRAAAARRRAGSPSTRADVHRELEAAGRLGAADGAVDLGLLGGGEASPAGTGAPGAPCELDSICSGVTSSAAPHALGGAAEPLRLAAPATGPARSPCRWPSRAAPSAARSRRRCPSGMISSTSRKPSGETSGACSQAGRRVGRGRGHQRRVAEHEATHGAPDRRAAGRRRRRRGDGPES